MQHLTDPAGFIERFYTQMTRDVLDGDDHTEVVDRYHAPDVLEIADGIEIDREKLIAHMRPVTRNVTDFKVDVHEAIADDDRLAARYTLHATSRGKEILTDVHFFGRFTSDGRLRRAHMLTSSRSA